MTLNCDISRTSWHMKVSDGSFFCIFRALSFGPNFSVFFRYYLLSLLCSFIYNSQKYSNVYVHDRARCNNVM